MHTRLECMQIEYINSLKRRAAPHMALILKVQKIQLPEGIA